MNVISGQRGMAWPCRVNSHKQGGPHGGMWAKETDRHGNRGVREGGRERN